MSGGDLILLGGVFLGGAAPWLEAIVVVPPGILAGLHPVAAVTAGASGNLVTVALAAVFGERIRQWWFARRARRKATTPGSTTNGHGEARRGRRQRVERVVQRWGIPALALLGPVGLGTQISVLVAVGAGTSARAAFAWIGAGTVLWSIVVAVATVAGLSLT